MKISVVYISRRRDLTWLVYSLQLLFEFLKGSFQVVVRLDEDCRQLVTTEWNLPVRYVFLQRPWPDGYMHKMYQVFIADDYVDWDTDVIWLLDSDHMLTREAHVEEFFEGGKPLLHYKEFSDLPPEYVQVTQAKWGEPTERALGIQLPRDYMVAPPFAFHLDTFRNCRQRITKVNAMSLVDVGYSEVPFRPENFLTHHMTLCDYETLGLYAATFEPDRYAIRQAPANWPFRVCWTYGPMPQEIDQLLHS
jgi:hypothetical protein